MRRDMHRGTWPWGLGAALLAAVLLAGARAQGPVPGFVGRRGYVLAQAPVPPSLLGGLLSTEGRFFRIPFTPNVLLGYAVARRWSVELEGGLAMVSSEDSLRPASLSRAGFVFVPTYIEAGRRVLPHVGVGVTRYRGLGGRALAPVGGYVRVYGRYVRVPAQPDLTFVGNNRTATLAELTITRAATGYGAVGASWGRRAVLGRRWLVDYGMALQVYLKAGAWWGLGAGESGGVPNVRTFTDDYNRFVHETLPLGYLQANHFLQFQLGVGVL